MKHDCPNCSCGEPYRSAPRLLDPVRDPLHRTLPLWLAVVRVFACASPILGLVAIAEFPSEVTLVLATVAVIAFHLASVWDLEFDRVDSSPSNKEPILARVRSRLAKAHPMLLGGCAVLLARHQVGRGARVDRSSRGRSSDGPRGRGGGVRVGRGGAHRDGDLPGARLRSRTVGSLVVFEMSGKPAWMRASGAVGRGIVEHGEVVAICPTEEHARVYGAAPALVRELLQLEWMEKFVTMMSEDDACPRCGCWGPISTNGKAEHEPLCSLNAALTAAGFPDQASRDAAREALKGKR
jgi:hypothetical protein